jgi:CheY-like chemotaxis protein
VNRRILLIDADPAFRASLTQQLERYRFEVAAEPDAEQALAQAAAAPPALLMVAVEEPDKAGFKIFQRCKKGALAKVPIVLVTSSVAPDSFAKHRGLKVHADEYLDKRSVSDDELLGKIDNLVGLGEPTGHDDLDVPLEVDEIPLSSDDMVLEETMGEDEAGAGEEVRVDSMVDAETDAAFAALLGDEAPAPPEAHAQLQADDPTPIPEPLPHLSDPPGASHAEARDVSVVMAAVPSMVLDGGRPQDSGGVEFDTFSRESMRPPVDLIARARAEHREHREHREQPDHDNHGDHGDHGDHGEADASPEHTAAPVESHESVSGIAIDVEDLEQIEDQVAAAPPPAPPPAAPPAPPPDPAPSKPKFREVSTVVEARPLVPPAAPQAPATGQISAPVPDLGLDEIATEATTDHSGVYDRRALRKLGELERQIAQLKTELDRARATADASARGTNREREFLNLREQIIAKDKELHRAKDEVRARDRELAEAHDRLRDLETTRTAIEARAAELEQRVTAEAHRAVTLEIRDKAQGAKLAALSQELEARTHAAAAAEAARGELERELAGERALRAASTSEAERALRVEREQLVARHHAELTAVRQEAAAAHDAALEALHEQLEGEHAAAIASATEATRTEIASEADRTVSQLEAKHGRELARLKGEHHEALAQLTDERDAAMARIATEREAAVTAVEDEHHDLIARLQTERAAELAQAREDAALQLSHARAELGAQLAHVQQEAEARLAATTAARDRAIAELTAELDRRKHQLDAMRAEHEATLRVAVADQAAALDEQARLHAAELARRDQEHDATRAEAAAAHDEAHAALSALSTLRTELEHQTAHHGQALDATRKELEELIEHHEHAKGMLVEQQRHAAELAQAHDDKQRVIEGLQHAVAEARAAAERAAAQHRAAVEEHAELAAREAAEHRTALAGAKRAMDEAAARHQAERAAAERAAAEALDDQKAQYERALAVAHGETVRTKAVADAEHGKAIAALSAEHERQHKELTAEHKKLTAEHKKLAAELTTERDELQRGLSSARDAAKRHEAELASAVQTIADRTAELRSHATAIDERDQRIADLRREFETLEQENASYQEQVLRAYQKIKTDEAMVARAKKAMAIALTVLDDQGNPKTDPT